jgi:hypothetical protein
VLSQQDIERYRRMTPAERLRETRMLSRCADDFLRSLPAEERERRLAIARRQHERSIESLLAALYRT